MKPTVLTTCCAALLICSSVIAAVHNVPQDYGTIQAAIDASADGDSVILAPMTYSGSGNCNLNFKGKKITVAGTNPADAQTVESTILDCGGNSRGFVFYYAEGPDSKLAGVTITNGYAFLGGAIYCYNNSSPSISNCRIVNNRGVFGGGITCANPGSVPTISNCQIRGNSAIVGGGAMYCNGASPVIKNCVISGNSAAQGGAFYGHNPGSPVLTNCTVAGNNASQRAGGLYCYTASNLATAGTVLWQDAAQYGAELLVANMGTPTSVSVSYCDVDNSAANVIAETGCTVVWGQGNINLDPCLVQIGQTTAGTTSTAGDYHLLSDSPCVDAGDAAYAAAPAEVDIDGDARISGGRIDIGADEREASVLDVTLDANPENLNLGSGVKRINCIVTLTEGYDVASIVLTTIRLNGDIQAAWCQIDPDAQQLMAKFERSDIEKLIGPDDSSLALQLSGKLNDGTSFSGTDNIGISHAGGNNGNGNGNGSSNGNGKAKGKG